MHTTKIEIVNSTIFQEAIRHASPAHVKTWLLLCEYCASAGWPGILPDAMHWEESDWLRMGTTFEDVVSASSKHGEKHALIWRAESHLQVRFCWWPIPQTVNPQSLEKN